MKFSPAGAASQLPSFATAHEENTHRFPAGEHHGQVQNRIHWLGCAGIVEPPDWGMKRQALLPR